MENPQKILALNGFLALPDDFIGTVPDALRWFADYFEKHPTWNESDNTNKQDTWNTFLDIYGKGFKWQGIAALDVYLSESNTYTPVEIIDK
jgi:hypothetical protein